MPRRARSMWFRSGAHNYHFRQAHTALLAKPNYRRTQKLRLKDTPSRIFDEPIWPVSKTAMKLKSPSLRTAKLSVSRTQIKTKIMETRNIRPHGNWLGRFPSGSYVRNRGALRGRPKARVLMLATPKLVRLVQNICDYKPFIGDEGVKRLRTRVQDALRNNYTSIYRPAKSTVSKISFCKKTKSTQSLKSQKDWERHRLWLEKRASSKRIWPPAPLPRRKHRTIEQLMVRMPHLVELPARKVAPPPPERPYVEERALAYEASDRIKIMAKPRAYDPERGPLRLFMGVTKAALQYTPSPRMEVLATPIIKSKRVDTDLKENPYAINPLALKAWCSPRLKTLALPRKRAS